VEIVLVAARGALQQPHRARLTLLVDVERRFPDRDLAVAHRPHLDPAPLHLPAGDPVLPPAFPVIGDDVIGEGTELLLELIVLLPLPAAAEQLFERRLAGELGKVANLTTQSSVKPAKSASMFHGVNSRSTCATKARASSTVRGFWPAIVILPATVVIASGAKQSRVA
jgi:hypothetical protein